jgi:hypothetical protein
VPYVVRRVASRGLSACALAAALWLYGWNWSYTGPAYWVVHAVLVGALVGAACLVRPRGGEQDGAGRTLNHLAGWLAVLVAVGRFVDAEVSTEGSGHDGACGLTSTIALDAMARGGWVWVLAVGLVVAAVRRPELRQLPVARAGATVALVASAPVLTWLGAIAVAREFMHGGAAVLVGYPLLVGAGATAFAWARGTPSAVAVALRKVVPVVAVLAVALASTTLRWLPSCDGAWGYTWPELSLWRLGLPVTVLAVALAFVRTPSLPA